MNLLIVTNMFIVLQEVSVLKQLGMHVLKLKTTNTAYNDFYNNEQVCRDLRIIDCG